MTKIDAAFGAKILAESAIVALVGSRVYYDDLPVGVTLPALCISKVSDIPHNSVPGMYTARIQVSVWTSRRTVSGADSPQITEEIVQAIVDAFNATNLEKSVELWTVGTERYSVHSIRVTAINRVRDPELEWNHVPIDFLMEFRRL